MPRRLSEAAYNLHRISQLPVLRIKRAAQLSFNSLLHKLSQIINIKHRTLVVLTREYWHLGRQLSQSREIPLRIRPINHRRAQNAHFETIAFQLMQLLFCVQLTVPIESIRIFFRISSQHLRLQRPLCNLRLRNRCLSSFSMPLCISLKCFAMHKFYSHCIHYLTIKFNRLYHGSS